MKKRGLIGRVVSTALVTAMVMTMGGMSAFAAGVVSGTDENPAIKEVPVKKIVTTDGQTYAPDETFRFDVKTGEAGSFNDGKNTLVVEAGVPGGLKFEAGAVFTASMSNALQDFYQSEGKLTVDVSKFTKAGVYHYVVNEVKGTYEGIKYDETEYNVYVYVYRNDDNSLYVGNVVSAINGEKADLTFTNDYGKNEENDTTHDVTITKKVTGNQGVKDDLFKFTVKVDAADSKEEHYKVVVKKNKTAEEEIVRLHAGDEVSYPLSHDGTIQIFGLSAGDTYTVTEDDYTSSGYTTKVDGDDGRVATGNATKDDMQHVVENNKTVNTPTGIILSFAPYILMVALAGVFAFLFLRKKRDEF